MNRRVVITGMGIVSPLGQSIDSAYARLKKLENCVEVVESLKGYEGLNSHLAALAHFEKPGHWNRKTTRTMGEVAMYALAATEQAVSDASLDSETLESGRTGVAYGSCSGSIEAHLDFFSLMSSHKVERINSGTYIKLMPQTTACNISVYFKTHGRLVPTGTACTSGSLAIGNAYELIKNGKQDVMIAGGAEEFSPTQVAIFDTLYATSLKNDTPDKTPSPYSIDRDGLVIGEGACTLILEEYERAKARGAKIYAEVVGFSENTDGTHVTNPNAETMALCLKGAIEDAGISADRIGYVNGHGTATKSGDIAETQATYSVFQRAVPISSTKSYIGHTLGACGAIEAAMTILSMNEGWFHPNLNFVAVDPELGALDYITGEGRRIDTDYVMSNNFAFGGVNTSLIFKKVK
ncbi:MAG: beta-ketoacyl-ACP synthase [Kiritimatiellae bacterium]|nr:beta-ketoacyl-ACP synthase [Kiritimatiellia bacterium]